MRLFQSSEKWIWSNKETTQQNNHFYIINIYTQIYNNDFMDQQILKH